MSDSPNAAEKLCESRYMGLTCALVKGHHLLPFSSRCYRLLEWDYPEHLLPKLTDSAIENDDTSEAC